MALTAQPDANIGAADNCNSPKSACVTGCGEEDLKVLSISKRNFRKMKKNSRQAGTGAGAGAVARPSYSRNPSLSKWWRTSNSSVSTTSDKWDDNGSTVDTRITTTSEDDDSLGTENENANLLLEQKFPTSTAMERKRFLTGRTLERAIQKMGPYMEWRQQYKLDDPSYVQQRKQLADLRAHGDDVWDFAVEHTAKYYECPSDSSSSSSSGGSCDPSNIPSKLPNIIKFVQKAADGRHIALVLPGLIDKKLAPLDFYARCVGVLLDVQLDRHSDDSIYVMVDVRAGLNWPNLSPASLLPFVKSLNRQLIDAMPERMHQTFVFPIPPVAKPIWALFKNLLDKKVTAKISILWGGAGTHSPIPKGLPGDVFEEDVVEQLEDARRSEFQIRPVKR